MFRYFRGIFCIVFVLSRSLLSLQLDIPDDLSMVVLIMSVSTVLLFSGITREYRTRVIVIKSLIMDAVVGAGCPYLSIALSLRLFKN